MGDPIASPQPWLVVGLGNPGAEYAGNRHNIGFGVVDELAVRAGSRFSAHKTRADVAEARLGGRRVVLAKPRSFMNESGGPVAAVRNFYRIDVPHVIVVHDELDLEFGALRLKQGGGDGGHNGLRSITKSLGSPDYVRVRFGIGRPPGRMQPADFVLRDFSVAERRDLAVLVDRAADAVESVVQHGLLPTQNLFHSTAG
jgi:PTH1 family peptidyl-tRNA hydrolase